MLWRRETSKRVRPVVVVTGALVVVAVAAGAVWLVARDDVDLGDELGRRDGWLRTEAEPGAVAVSGAAGGAVRVVAAEDGEPFRVSTNLNPPHVGDAAPLEGSAAPDVRPVAAAAEGSGERWLVVGRGPASPNERDAQLTAWSSIDAEEPDGDGDAPPVPGVELPDSAFSTGTRTITAAVSGDYQVVAAADHTATQVVVWGRRGDGPWDRSTIDPLESARSTPAPERSVIGEVKVAGDGDGFVLAATGGDPAILSVWSSGPLDGGPVSWRRTAEDLDGEPACSLSALHASAPGVLLGWSPLGPNGCMDQEEARFAIVGGSGDTRTPPTLDPQVPGAIVRDAVVLRDGTTVVVGSREQPPHSATGDDERAPVMWVSDRAGGWELLEGTPVVEQLDQEATTISIDGWSPGRAGQTDSADTLDHVFVVTRPYDPLATPSGMELWTWERNDDE